MDSEASKTNEDVEARLAKWFGTERERRVLSRNRQRSEAEVPAPRVKISNEGKVPTISPDHPNAAIGFQLLAEALGSTSEDFVNGLLIQIANAASPGQEPSESHLNFVLSVIKNIKPTNQIEAMLAAQMAVTHMATMTFARKLARVDTLQQLDSMERAYNKLTRTYAAQMETLKRYRTGGEQKVTVQHVSVNDGGQAIVGNVTHDARASNRRRPANATRALTDAQQPAMPLVDEPKGELVPLKRA